LSGLIALPSFMDLIAHLHLIKRLAVVYYGAVMSAVGRFRHRKWRIVPLKVVSCTITLPHLRRGGSNRWQKRPASEALSATHMYNRNLLCITHVRECKRCTSSPPRSLKILGEPFDCYLAISAIRSLPPYLHNGELEWQRPNDVAES